MESESKQVKQKLGVLGILMEAVTFYVKNINFIIFTFLTSLPFFFVMVYFEILFEETMIETPKIIPLLPFYEQDYANDIILLEIPDRSFSKDYLPVLIELVFIYLIPLHVLELWSAVVTMDSASRLRSDENNMSLKDMFKRSIDISTMKNTFVTSLYMLFWSTSILIAFPWIVALAKLLMMYLEWSAIWNMSFVVSVMEDIYGIEALRVSYFLSRVNTLKWVSCMIYFYDCKGRKMEKKVDVESVMWDFVVNPVPQTRFLEFYLFVKHNYRKPGCYLGRYYYATLFLGNLHPLIQSGHYYAKL
ncbi:hypothetical protein CR513_26324, partial [Mucuna pruriens]